jgi:hypothetical protein
MTAKLVQVVSPAHSVTGGPESLHNLVRLANRLGHPAEIVYHPFARGDAVPQPYRKYDTPVGHLRDETGVLIIFPETLCMQALRVRHAVAAIWWLSVNNFALIKYDTFRDRIRYLRSALKRKRPLWGARGMKHVLHLSKSAYDRDYLAKRGIDSQPLAGPISDFYLQPCTPQDLEDKQDLILYNPRKDVRLAPRLRSRFPEYRFVALSGLDEAGLRKAYLSAKLYIDFGHHPGKERMPREAAASGCCIVTGRRGSAANADDIPIPQRFKIDEADPHCFEKFEAAVVEIFDDFPRASADFEPYRAEILREPEIQAVDFRRIIAALG